MDNINTAIKDKREYSDLNLKEVEPITKINLRGKKKRVLYKNWPSTLCYFTNGK